MVLEEVKFFTNDDVLLDIITLLPPSDSSDGDRAPPPMVKLAFDGVSYVNTNLIPASSKDPSSKGLPPTTQRSIKRNATSELDTHFARSGCGSYGGAGDGTSCSAIRVEEHGTGAEDPCFHPEVK